MASWRKVLAAVGGVLVAFVLVMLLEFASPPADLRADPTELVLERFQFRDEGVRFTEGAELVLVSEVAVPVDLVLRAPSNETVAFTLEERGTRAFALDEEGVYVLASPLYPWIGIEVEVVAGNPVERFWDRVF